MGFIGQKTIEMGMRFEEDSDKDYTRICAFGQWDLVKIRAGKWEQDSPFRILLKRYILNLDPYRWIISYKKQVILNKHGTGNSFATDGNFNALYTANPGTTNVTIAGATITPFVKIDLGKTVPVYSIQINGIRHDTSTPQTDLTVYVGTQLVFPKLIKNGIGPRFLNPCCSISCHIPHCWMLSTILFSIGHW